VIDYALNVGFVVVPSYVAIQAAIRVMTAMFENQSILLSFAFP
jgi:hypothetical protein